MESIGIFNIDSESDLFVLHCVFLKLINQTLKDFAHAWNLHPLCTESNWSPRKIWVDSILRNNEDLDDVPEDFGVDFDGPLPDEEVGTVDVPDTVSSLNEHDMYHFLTIASSPPLRSDDGHVGVSHFIHCKELLQNMLDTESS